MKDPLLYKIVRPILATWFRLTYLPVIINKKVIPTKGRVILAGNHTNNNDGFLLGYSTKRCIRFIAKDELFKSKIGNWFFTNNGLIPVNRRIKDKSVIPACVKILNDDKIIGIFPEGTVNRTKDIIMPFKAGVIKMALESNSPIIPFAIVGKYVSFRKGIKIIFGEIYYPKTSDIEKEIKVLEQKVVTLLKNAGASE